MFDPVGIGASVFRKDTVKCRVPYYTLRPRKKHLCILVAGLLNTFQASVIKGNSGELAALAGSLEVSLCHYFSFSLFDTSFIGALYISRWKLKAWTASVQDSKILSRSYAISPRERVGSNIIVILMYISLIERQIKGCTVVLTGPTDYISDGTTVVSLHNGHELMGRITGSGCIVGSAVATYCAAAAARAPGGIEEDEGKLVRGNMLVAAVAGWVVPFLFFFLCFLR